MREREIYNKLLAHHIAAAEEVLSKGDRVELVPGPGGTVKILHIKRELLKTEPETACQTCKGLQTCKEIFRSGSIAKCIHWNEFTEKRLV